jgi:hypothetical protein
MRKWKTHTERHRLLARTRWILSPRRNGIELFERWRKGESQSSRVAGGIGVVLHLDTAQGSLIEAKVRHSRQNARQWKIATLGGLLLDGAIIISLSFSKLFGIQLHPPMDVHHAVYQNLGWTRARQRRSPARPR